MKDGLRSKTQPLVTQSTSKPVLKGLTLNCKPDEKVGIVGCTGSGKSSLALALFRFLDFHQGSILIDSVGISIIKLHDLSRRSTLIPQDPVLFSGTVRTNLDPFNDFSGTELESALQRVHLAAPISAEMVGSVRRTTAVPLPRTSRFIRTQDEATSAVDTEIDDLIQWSIRKELKSSTLPVIAHRLSAIVDFDRILVLDKGCAVEIGTPRELMVIDEYFRRLVDVSGDGESLEKRVFG
ncbi:P-loop containing nucleoside triphosphate hydrolase protein [Aspergillus leporis]|uniref:P-loop containing nucleoside triphosphate hydrolase protein n=1 Tax=Aspergillus leporis TaxID=41062 RepID=A0A5N5XB22_9EURO|nr:P-loop containing nucleoside triphosphate hydrolase protein [Aspergillus leporis]